jgi:hypothetical protein
VNVNVIENANDDDDVEIVNEIENVNDVEIWNHQRNKHIINNKFKSTKEKM